MEALVSFAAIGAAPREVFASRGWTEAEWSHARQGLLERGWINESGTATELGHEKRARIERRTDELAAQPWQVVGSAAMRRFARLTQPLLGAIIAADILPKQNTLGIGTS